MNVFKLTLPLFTVLCCAPMLASAQPLLGAELSSFSVLAGSYTTYGANATINGNVGALGYITAGADATSFNNYSGAAITYGAGAASFATNAAAAVTVGASANAGAVGTDISILNTAFTQFNTAKSALTNMGTGTVLSPTMGGTVALAPGVYSASALTTAAGTVITLDGKGAVNPFWVFNIDTYLVTGAATAVRFGSETVNPSVFWNVGGYTTLGANSTLLGVNLSTEYIVEGAGASISCGNAFSASYVGIGAGTTSSANNCAGSPKGLGAGLDILNGVAVATPFSISAVPEPAPYALFLIGLLALACRSWSFVKKAKL